MLQQPYKLGKEPRREDPRTLLFDKYIFGKLPETPQQFNWSGKVGEFGMVLNDQLGICTIAAAVHMIQVWTANAGRETIIPDETALQVYKEISGYDGSPEKDNGCVVLDVLKYWRKQSIGGSYLGAFAKINPLNHKNVLAGAYMDLGLYIGAQMPEDAQDQFMRKIPWYSTGANTIGGHAINIADTWSKGLVCITWGREQPITWDWWDKNVDETYALFSNDFLDEKGVAPNGFDKNKLLADLQLL